MANNITRKYALALVRSGVAEFGDLCHDSDKSVWVEVNEKDGDRQWFCTATQREAAGYVPERRVR